MRVLAIEPYYGGSHRAFLDDWRDRSQHGFSVFSLPGYKWKWRMRHASLTLAEGIRSRFGKGCRWDLIWCSDMLNLPELLGMVPEISHLPTVIYFHENQLTYPSRHSHERDHHYAYTNFLSACRADRVWFNSAFHRDEFLSSLQIFLRKMPDFQHVESAGEILAKSDVQPPGVRRPGVDREANEPPRRRGDGLRILWCARWEHDKNPEDFFAAMEQLRRWGIPFRVGAIGPSYRHIPAVFAQAKADLNSHIDFWGYQASRDDYERVLFWADVVVSTAVHEFFGMSVVEAIAAGAFPLLPRRLAYPEVVGAGDASIESRHFFDGTPAGLARCLAESAKRHERGELWEETRGLLRERVGKYYWDCRATELDREITRITNLTRRPPYIRPE